MTQNTGTVIAVGGIAFQLFDEDVEFQGRYDYLLVGSDSVPQKSLAVYVSDRDFHEVPRNSEVAVNLFSGGLRIEKKDCWRAEYLEVAGRVNIEISRKLLQIDANSRAVVVSSVLRILVCELRRREGVLLFHASSVVSGGQAHLFLGESGVGKSTVCKLSGDRSLLGDEIAVVSPVDEGERFLVEPSPFVSERNLPRRSSISYPLGSLNFLEQSKEEERVRIDVRLALPQAMRCMLHFSDIPHEHELALDNALRMLSSVPAYRLRFSLSDKFWRLID